VAIDFRADPVGQRTKGWVPRGQGKLKLVPGWEPRPEYGAGQALEAGDGGAPADAQPPSPPADPDLQAHLGGGWKPPPTPVPADQPDRVATQTVAPQPAPVYHAPQAPALSPPAPRRPAPQPSPPPGAPQAPSGGGPPPPAPPSPAPPPPKGSTPPPQAGNRTASQQSFLNDLTPTAKKVSAETGIPWQVLVAIPANETGWGSAVFHNNYFGVKDPKGQPSRTWEEVNGQRVDITDNFATYDNAEASMRGFVSFLQNNPRYADALAYIQKNPSDWPTFVQMLHKQGYATDSNWSNQVIGIGHGLESSSTMPTGDMSPGSSVSSASRGEGKLFDVAKSAIGSKYVWGGAGGRSNFDQPFVGSDCSGFAAWAYRNGLGINLPAYTGSIWSASSPISQQDAVPGDLILFGMNQSDPAQQHVAIYEGNGMMIHDSSANPDGGVEETSIWPGGSFRRVNGVTPADLSTPGAGPGVGTSTTTSSPQTSTKGQLLDPSNLPRDDPNHPITHLQSTYPNFPVTRLGGGNMGAGQDDNPVGGFFSSLGSAANQALSNVVDWASPAPVSPEQVQQAGQDMSFGPGGGFGAPTGGEQLAAQRNAAIEQANPIRDVPVVGGATTLAAQTVLDPTNLVLAGAAAPEEAAARVATEAAPAAEQAVAQHNPLQALSESLAKDLSAPKPTEPYVNPAAQVESPRSYPEPSKPPEPPQPSTPLKPSPPTSAPAAPTGPDASQLTQANQVQHFYNNQGDVIDVHATPGVTDNHKQFSFVNNTTGAVEHQTDDLQPAHWAGDKYALQSIYDDAMSRKGPGLTPVPSSLAGEPTAVNRPPSSPEYARTPAGPSGWTPEPVPGERGQRDANGMTDSERAAAQAFHQFYGGDISSDELTATLGYGMGLNAARTQEAVRSVQQYALEQMRQGYPGFLKSLPMVSVHQMGSFTADDARTQAFRYFARLGTDGIRPGPNYYSSPGAWKPENTLGDAGGHGEVQAKGWYTDTNPRTARDRMGGPIYTRMYNLTKLDPTKVLDLMHDPSASGVMHAAFKEAEDRYNAAGGGRSNYLDDPAWNAHLTDVLKEQGYDGVYGGGYSNEPGELLLLRPPEELGSLVADGTYRDIMGMFQGLPKWTPSAFAGFAVASYLVSRDNPKFQKAIDQWKAPAQGMGTGTQRGKPTMSKKEASYTKKAPDDNCQDCQMFSKNTCSLVKGFIHDRGSCDYFEPAKAQMGAGQDNGTPWWQQATDFAQSALQSAESAAGNVVGGVVQQATRPADLAPGQVSAKEQLGLTGPQADQPLPPPAPQPSPAPQRQSLQAPTNATGQPILQAPPPPDQPRMVSDVGIASRLPTLPADNPIISPRADPTAKDAAVGDALATSVLPDQIANQGVDTPIGKITAHDVAAQALRPSALAALPVTGAANVGMNVGEYAATKAAEAGLSKLGAAGAAAAERVAPVVGKAVGTAADAAIRPVADKLAGTPFGKFITEDVVPHRQQAQAAVGFALAPARGAAIGATTGGALSVYGDVSHATPEQMADPSWWPDVAMRAAQNAKFGGELGLGLGAVAPVARWGWDHTVGPGVMQAFRAAFEPVKNIPSTLTQEAYMTRADKINKAMTASLLLQMQGEKLFGKAGQGLNTVDAAAYIEDKRTLQGFVGRGGEVATPEQEAWVKQRVTYEDVTGDEMRRTGVLSPTQDVTTPTGAPGPSAHVMHLYEGDQPGQVGWAKKKSGVGWSDTVTHHRETVLDPQLGERPRTIAEAQAAHANNPYGPNNTRGEFQPMDDMVTRFSTSLYQSERALANRDAWVIARNDPQVSFRLTPGQRPPPDWQQVDPNWHMGYGQQQYMLEPNLARYLDNITGVAPTMRDWPIINWLWGANAPLKMAAFAASPVHMTNVVLRAHSVLAANGVLGNGVGELLKGWVLPTFRPGGLTDLMLGNARTALRAADAGVTLGHWGDDLAAQGTPSIQNALKRMTWAGAGSGSAAYLNAKRTGATDAQAWDAAWKAGLLGTLPFAPGAGALLKGGMKIAGHDVSQTAAMSTADLIHNAIFYQALPAAKIGMWDMLTRSGADEHLAADLVNETLGGLDLVKIGRAPWMQDLLRFGLVSSDFEEGEIRTLWNAFGSGPRGAFTRGTFVKGMATIYGTTELLNLAGNGHFMHDNGRGHEWDLETTGFQDRLADLAGKPEWRSVDPATGAPTRTYQEVMTPLRWIMQTLGEGTKQLAYSAGQLETLSPDEQEAQAGAQLNKQYGGDVSQGNLPPNLGHMLGQDLQLRQGFGLSMGKGLVTLGGTLASGRDQAFDWTGKKYSPPGAEPQSPWAAAGTALASMIASDAPSGISSTLQKINVEHPEKSRLMDAIMAGTGAARLSVQSEVADNLQAAENLKEWLGFDPQTQQTLDQAWTNQRQANTDARQKIFADAPTSSATHAELDRQLQDNSVQRKDLTTRQQLAVDYLKNVSPDVANKVQQFFQKIYDPKGDASTRPADTQADLSGLAQGYWQPADVDPKDTAAVNKARYQVLGELGQQTGEEPYAIEDAFKWTAQNTDSNGIVKPMPTLPGVTSAQLGQMATDFLNIDTDTNGKTPSDPDAKAQRADDQRAYLDQQARALGVDANTLLERINLRLASPDQAQSGLEKSYNNALQAYFDSKDASKFPRYVFPDGHSVTAQDEKSIDRLLATASSAQKKYDPEVRQYVDALKEGTDRREQSIQNSPYRADYEQWFGLGRNMSEGDYAAYSQGDVLGYKDLSGANAPKNETIKRDMILELYRASDLQQRANTHVTVWVNGQPRDTNLLAAYRYLHNKNVYIPTAGRDLPSTAASDDANPSGDQLLAGVQ
jgi:cell wall-associated NlpC family hydrolase